jgi:hypothetical protein
MSISVIIIRVRWHRNIGILRTPNAADSPRRLYPVHSPRKHQDLYDTPFSAGAPYWCDYEGVSKSFRTDCLGRELQRVELSATRCSCIAILWVSLVSFAAISLCVTSQRVFIVVNIYISLSTQSGNFWIHPCTPSIVAGTLRITVVALR